MRNSKPIGIWGFTGDQPISLLLIAVGVHSEWDVELIELVLKHGLHHTIYKKLEQLIFKAKPPKDRLVEFADFLNDFRETVV